MDRNDLATLVVANHIIAFAKAGVLDPARLRDLTLKAIQREQRPPTSVDQPMSREPVDGNVTGEAADA